MSLRDIVKDGEPILRMKSREVVAFDEKLAKMIDDMWETMHKAEGCGLAAPQIGILRRVAVVEVPDTKVEFVNPVITYEAGENVDSEGCLSVPGKSAYVKRPDTIKVKYQDRDGGFHEDSFKGYAARACCHEIDHLEGILYYDKALSDKEARKYEEEL